MTTNIHLRAGDIGREAPDLAEAVALWLPYHPDTWDRTLNWMLDKWPVPIGLENQTVETLWRSETDRLWEFEQPFRQLRYVYVFANPETEYGCRGLEEMTAMVTRCLDHLSSLQVRRVAMINTPVMELNGRREMNIPLCVKAQRTCIRQWVEQHPGLFDEIFLVDRAHYFPEYFDYLETAPPILGSIASIPVPSTQYCESQNPFFLSLEWTLARSIALFAEANPAWAKVCRREAVELRDWCNIVWPGVKFDTADDMDELIRDLDRRFPESDLPEPETTNKVSAIGVEGRLSECNHGYRFPLSLAGAWMVTCGLEAYLHQTRHMYVTTVEDAGYCHMMASTAIAEAKNLRDWITGLKDGTVDDALQAVEMLLSVLEADRHQFRVLAVTEDEERDRQDRLKSTPESPAQSSGE